MDDQRMSNQDRRAALEVARMNAFIHAGHAANEFENTEPSMRSINTHSNMAVMWASVANALKTGDAAADS